MTIREACDAYLREIKARNLSKGSREGYESLFRNLQAFADGTGIARIDALDRAAIRAWREQWKWAHSTQVRVLRQLQAFFGFLLQEGWIRESPIEGIRKPKADPRPTMPLSRDEMRALLAAAGPTSREHALLLLLRYSGLAIIDAATLRRDALEPSGELVLRRAKSGELVTVALPDQVIVAMEAVAQPGQQHFFWTGVSQPGTAAKYWRARLARIAATAAVEGFHPHRLRDTFAVELLLADVPIQDVSTLLGHSSVATTERYYAPWNLARRARLAAIVREANLRDPILQEFTLKKPAGSAATLPAEAGLAAQLRSQATRRAYA